MFEEILSCDATCPCCGYKTVGSDYDICHICFWELSPLADADDSGANPLSLREAQQNFQRFGAMSERYLDSVDPPGPEDRRDPNWRPEPPALKGSESPDPDWYLRDATCACCGFKTVGGGGEMCEICGWIFSPQQEDPSQERGPNSLCLWDGQTNFAHCGAKIEELRPFLRSPSSCDRKDPDWHRLTQSDLLIPRKRSSPLDYAKLLPQACPCCGYSTVNEYGRCYVCSWEYYTGHQDPMDRSTPNPIPLKLARDNYRRLGAIHDRYLPHVRPPRPEESAAPFIAE